MKSTVKFTREETRSIVQASEICGGWQRDAVAFIRRLVLYNVAEIVRVRRSPLATRFNMSEKREPRRSSAARQSNTSQPVPFQAKVAH
jgi:hypothetical protein